MRKIPVIIATTLAISARAISADRRLRFLIYHKYYRLQPPGSKATVF